MDDSEIPPRFRAERFQDLFEDEKKRNRRILLDDLETLSHRAQKAIAAIRADECVDEHLITNASYITARLTRYNLVREWDPYVEKPKKGSGR